MPKLYRHYKNKPYKYLGEARHSETLEHLVLYETRYPNELGTLWVRPKEMFFESVCVDGVAKARFEKVEVRYVLSSELQAGDKVNILALLEQAFGGYSEQKLEATLRNRKEILLVSAYAGDRFVGFKLGYNYNDERFYSWLGAVDLEFRGVGIGQELMEMQHAWCKERKFKLIETRTKNKWRQMLLLNIKNGFEIVGTYTNPKGETKIILEKKLA